MTTGDAVVQLYVDIAHFPIVTIQAFFAPCEIFSRLRSAPKGANENIQQSKPINIPRLRRLSCTYRPVAEHRYARRFLFTIYDSNFTNCN